jgi:hypothetical protein
MKTRIGILGMGRWLFWRLLKAYEGSDTVEIIL